MSPAVFRLVLLVSCAHAMVHVYELSLPSVEQNIGAEFEVNKAATGTLGSAFRVPWGFGALIAGWLADRFGSKPMLVIYLAGCGAVSIAAALAPDLATVFVTMFLLGSFASIYHPAGLAIISREAPIEARGPALGWHGIFGSIGIAAAPFLAWFWLGLGFTWRDYYVLLAVPGVMLAIALWFTLTEKREEEPHNPLVPTQNTLVSTLRVGTQGGGTSRDVETFRATPFFLLMIVAVLSGLVYSAFMHFLPRYLSGSGLRPSWGGDDVRFAKLAAALVLGCGIFGQSLAGKLVRPHRLPALLAMILLANAPVLVWMAYATGPGRPGFERIASACLLGFVHFMHQPVYNSLVAQMVPSRRRSLGYGFSNMIGFGLGGFGATIAGHIASERDTYLALAALAILAGLMAIVMGRAAKMSS
jgi:MFS family permease